MKSLFAWSSLLCLWTCVLGATGWSQPPMHASGAVSEPISHAEVQAQNKHPDKITPEEFARWRAYVAARPEQEQVWLRTLAQQLGSFYGPTYMKQLIDGNPQLTPANDAWAYVKDDPHLPRVLVIGDSISRSYTAPLRLALAGKANVHRAPANCGRTDYFFEHGEVWLEQNGSNRWDLVILNYGIHDYDKSPEQFVENLRKIVARLRQTGARIVWVRTTPWSRSTDDPFLDRSPKTNETSDALARAEGLAVVDLHTPMLAERGRLQYKDNTHWQDEGARLMGDIIARAIEPQLQSVTSPGPRGGESPATTIPDGNRYGPGLAWIAQRQRVDAMRDNCDLIFIGDSITAGWDAALWRERFVPRRALNYGIPGDSVQNVLFRLNYEGLTHLRPKVAVILIGTNNPGPAAETAAGIRAVVDRTRTLFPGVTVVLMDLLPTARRTAHVMAVNSLIGDFADGRSVVRLDLGERMVRQGESWKGLKADRLHLTAEGYQIWAEMLEPLLVASMGPLPKTP